jgi:hypothetical protein
MTVAFNLCDVVIRTDRDRAKWPRMSVRNALVIYRDIEEAGRAERLAGRFDLLQMSAKGLFPLVEAEDCLEGRRSRSRSRHVIHERVVETMANTSFERLVEDSASAHGVDVLQLEFDIADLLRRPLLDNRRVEAAKLGDVKEWPRTLDGCWPLSNRKLIPKPGAKVRQRSVERELLGCLVERRSSE